MGAANRLAIVARWRAAIVQKRDALKRSVTTRLAPATSADMVE